MEVEHKEPIDCEETMDESSSEEEDVGQILTDLSPAEPSKKSSVESDLYDSKTIEGFEVMTVMSELDTLKATFIDERGNHLCQIVDTTVGHKDKCSGINNIGGYTFPCVSSHHNKKEMYVSICRVIPDDSGKYRNDTFCKFCYAIICLIKGFAYKLSWCACEIATQKGFTTKDMYAFLNGDVLGKLHLDPKDNHLYNGDHGHHDCNDPVCCTYHTDPTISRSNPTGGLAEFIIANIHKQPRLFIRQIIDVTWANINETRREGNLELITHPLRAYYSNVKSVSSSSRPQVGAKSPKLPMHTPIDVENLDEDDDDEDYEDTRSTNGASTSSKKILGKRKSPPSVRKSPEKIQKVSCASQILKIAKLLRTLDSSNKNLLNFYITASDDYRKSIDRMITMNRDEANEILKVMTCDGEQKALINTWVKLPKSDRDILSKIIDDQ